MTLLKIKKNLLRRSEDVMRRIVTLLLAVSVSGTAWANYDFQAADALFLARGDGPAKIKQAVSAYQQALATNLSNDEKAYAVEQIGALQIYYGYIVNQSDTSGRVQIANLCIETTNKIAPSASQPKTPQYYFWKAICTMAYANAAGPLQSLSLTKPVLKLIADGRKVNASYEGGGFDRLEGVMYTKLPPINLSGPSQDLGYAETKFKDSLDAGAYAHPLNPSWRNMDYEVGNYFYATHLYYAEALVKQSRHGEAKELIENALAAMAAGEIAPGRKPEAEVAKREMQSILASLN